MWDDLDEPQTIEEVAERMAALEGENRYLRIALIAACIAAICALISRWLFC